MPTSIAAPTAGPHATRIVQMARLDDLKGIRFIHCNQLMVTPGPTEKSPPFSSLATSPLTGDLHRYDLAGQLAVGGSQGVSDELLFACSMGGGGQQRVELGVHGHTLFDLRRSSRAGP